MFSVPQEKKALHQFIGLINYYHHFVPRCTKILQPLHLVLKDDSFIWTASCQQAFKAAKMALPEAVMLVHPQQHAPSASRQMHQTALLEQCLNSSLMGNGNLSPSFQRC